MPGYMNNPYQQNFMQNPYQMPAYQPPMQDRLAQLQNQYQAAIQQNQQIPVQQPLQMQYIQQPQMIGRYVNDFAEVTANDVPMDGRSAVFVKSDLSEIQTRAWSADGKIIPITFRPVPVEQKENQEKQENLKIDLSDESTKAFMRRFDDISDRLEKMEKSLSKQSAPVSKVRKGADGDE